MRERAAALGGDVTAARGAAAGGPRALRSGREAMTIRVLLAEDQPTSVPASAPSSTPKPTSTSREAADGREAVALPASFAPTSC